MAKFFLSQWCFWATVMTTVLSLLLIVLALKSLNQSREKDINSGRVLSADTMAVSIIVPAYNEQAIICNTVQALLRLQHDAFEIIVVNDGSTDQTLGVLRSALHLREIPMVPSTSLPHKRIDRLFDSRLDPRIRVVDKLHGGKFDALNAGISISKYPWFCCVDADTIPMQDALSEMMTQMQRHPSAIGVAGQVRVGNIRHTSGRLLVMAQVVEYVRAFVIERIGWSEFNALVIVPGAFSLFSIQAVCEVGGYSSGMPTEDVELVIKLHRHNLRRRRKYRVLYAPKAIAWTEAPKNLISLTRQRERWYRGLWAAIYRHRSTLLHPRYGVIGLFVLPYLLLFELLRPAFVVFTFMASVLCLNSEIGTALLRLFLLNFVGQCLLSSAMVLIDWSNFRQCYTPLSVLWHTLASIVIERSIYSFLLAVFKIQAFIMFVLPFVRESGKWQTVTRVGFKLPSSEMSVAKNCGNKRHHAACLSTTVSVTGGALE